MAKFFKWKDGKRYVGSIEQGETSIVSAPNFKLLKMLINGLSNVVKELESESIIRLKSETFTTNLDKVSPSSTDVEFDSILELNGKYFSLNSNKKEITIKRSGQYAIDAYLALETTFDGEYITAGIYRTNKGAKYLTTRESATGTATLGVWQLSDCLTLKEGDVLTLRTHGESGTENGVKKRSGQGVLTIRRISQF